jgi:hypothetical protein
MGARGIPGVPPAMAEEQPEAEDGDTQDGQVTVQELRNLGSTAGRRMRSGHGVEGQGHRVDADALRRRRVRHGQTARLRCQRVHTQDAEHERNRHQEMRRRRAGSAADVSHVRETRADKSVIPGDKGPRRRFFIEPS